VTHLGDHGCNIFGCPPCNGSNACTLRQAIEKANLSADPAIDIVFAPSLVGSAISVGSPMPTITRSGLRILGQTPAGAPADVEFVVQPSADAFLRVNASDVTLVELNIARRAAAGSSTAIELLGGANLTVADVQIGAAFTAEEGKRPLCQASGPVEPGTIGILARAGVGANARIMRNTIGCMGRGIALAGADGVGVGWNSASNTPAPNSLGYDPFGDRALPNGIGASITDYLPVAGAPAEGIALGNLISSNIIAYNEIGIVFEGRGAGVQINEASQNSIGNNESSPSRPNGTGILVSGKTLITRIISNRIGGNTGDGVVIQGTSPDLSSRDFLVWSNQIGARGGVAMPNGGAGVRIRFFGSGGSIRDNTVAGNGGDGIFVGAGGQTIEGNTLRGGGASGVRIESAGNTLRNNVIHDHAAHGVFLAAAGAGNNTLTGDTIHGNSGSGIRSIGGIAQPNRWEPAAIYGNGGLGIDANASAAGDEPTGPFAQIVEVTAMGSAMKIEGTAPPLPGGDAWQVLLYRAAADASGYGEGRARVGPALTASAATGWAWSHIDAAEGPKGCYTALLTRVTGGVATQSGEFSRLVCAYTLYVPVLYR
jgi:parallel beta-helix repeat protein